MADTVHNWDIEALKQMKAEICKICDVLKENRDLLVSEGFELLRDWHGKAGKKITFVTAANAAELDSLINKYTDAIEQLDTIISKCYEPCEGEIKAKVAQLIL